MKTTIKSNVYDSSSKKFINALVSFDEGLITDISRDNHVSQDVIDYSEYYMIPGLVDVHTHGRNGHDFNYIDEEGCKDIRYCYARTGVTTLMATLASAELQSIKDSIAAINNSREETPGTATLAGIHLEGLYLNPLKRGAHAERLLRNLDPSEIKELIDMMYPLPVHVSAAFELDNGKEFLSSVKSMGATCGLAHSNATYDESMEFCELGLDSFTHTFNAMRSIHHREPGNIIASLMSEKAYSELICDGFHVSPVMVNVASRLKNHDKLVLITDSLEAAGCDDGKYMLGGMEVTVKNGLAINSEGTIAGSTLNLFDAMKNFMKFTSLPIEEVIPMATINPSRMVRIDKKVGSIEKGKSADFIIIDDLNEPSIVDVYSKGSRVVR